MEPISALVTIIAAGASAALHDTAAQAVKDAYQGVKAVLAHRLHSWAKLEADPKDQGVKDAIAAEIQRSAANDNADILNKIDGLQAALKTVSSTTLERSGVSIEDVNAATEVLIKDVKYGKYFNVQRVSAKSGKVEISGLSSGLDPEKK